MSEEYKDKMRKIKEGFEGTESSGIKKTLNWLKGLGAPSSSVEEEADVPPKPVRRKDPTASNDPKFKSALEKIKKGYKKEEE